MSIGINSITVTHQQYKSNEPLLTFRSKPLNKNTINVGSLESNNLSANLSSGNQSGGSLMSDIINYNGRDFYLFDRENEKYMNDPDVRVSETGYLIKGKTDTLGGSFYILGKAVDAPEYVPSKYTHDFFDASSNSIMSAAREFATSGSNEISAYPAINASIDNFAKSMLDFFSVSKYTPSDFDKTKESIVNIVKELAEMLEKGEEADYSKLNGKIDIMGEQISLIELLDIQKYAKELSSQLIGEKNERVGLGSDDVGEFARKGIIKSMGTAYGDQIGGAVGEMFKSAWITEVDKHVQIIMDNKDRINKSIMSVLSDAEQEGTILHHNILKNGAQWIYDAFSKVDTSSKENALESYKTLSGEIDTAITKFLGQYSGGVPGGLATKMRSEVDSYFYDLMGFKSVDVRA